MASQGRKSTERGAMAGSNDTLADLNLRVTEVIPHVLFAGRTNLIFVEVRTDAGIIGLGEASLEGKTEAVVGAINDISDRRIAAEREAERAAQDKSNRSALRRWLSGETVRELSAVARFASGAGAPKSRPTAGAA